MIRIIILIIITLIMILLILILIIRIRIIISRKNKHIIKVCNSPFNKQLGSPSQSYHARVCVSMDPAAVCWGSGLRSAMPVVLDPLPAHCAEIQPQ